MRYAFVLILALAACAQETPRETGWRDTTGGARGQAGLDRDIAQCDYEFRQAQAVSPSRPTGGVGPYGPQMSTIGGALFSGPGPGYFQSCMNARGWKQVY